MANNDSINHDHDDMSTSASSSISSTTVKFSGRFGSDSMSVHVIDRTTGIERNNNNNNSIDLTNISDTEINHDANDNQTHSVFSIPSSISSSSSCCIIERPSSISLPVVSPEIPAYDWKQEEERSSYYLSKYPTTMVKKKQTAEEEFSDLVSGISEPSARSRRPPPPLNLSSGNNNNNNGNKSKKKKNHNTNKKKTPALHTSRLNAINRAGNSSKTQKRSLAQQRSPHISDDDDNDNDNDNVDDFHQPISTIVSAPPSIPLTSVPVPALRPIVQPASNTSIVANTTTDVSIFALSEIHKDMGLDNTVDERTRALSEFICRIDAIPGGLYGSDTEMIHNLSTNCKGYEKAKLRIIARLFAALEYNKELKHLTLFMDDPECPGTQVRTLYYLCRGVCTTSKYKVMNTALIWLSQYLIKQDYLGHDISDINIFIKAQLQPNTVATQFRMLFAAFKENSILYSLSKDFNQIGGLLAWWKRKFGICEEIDTKYGKTPNAATFDPKFREKRLIAHRNGKFQVFDGDNNRIVTNWTNFMRSLAEEVKVCCGLRSSEEPRQLHCDSFEFGIIQEGHFTGTPYVKLKGDHDGQKGKPTTLKNHTASQRTAHVDHLPIIKQEGVVFCAYNMLDLIINKFMPPKELLTDPGYIFRKEASMSQKAEWKKTHGNSCTWRANPHKSQVIGKNQFNRMSKGQARDCGYDNHETNTGHGARRCGISAVGNSGAGPSTVKTYTRHTNLNQSTTYHKSNEEDRMVAAVAVQGLKKTNNTANVADDDGYTNVGDDDNQPTQRQNQPSHRGRYPNQSSHNDQSITSPNRKRSKSRRRSITGPRSPTSSHASYESSHHHEHQSSSRRQSEEFIQPHDSTTHTQFTNYNDQFDTSLPSHNSHQQQTRSLSPAPNYQSYYHHGARPRSKSTSSGHTNQHSLDRNQERHHQNRSDLHGRDESQVARPSNTSRQLNDQHVYQGPPSPHDTYQSHPSDPDSTRQRPLQHAQGGCVPSHNVPRGHRQSSQAVSRSTSYQASAHLPNQGHSAQHYQQRSSSHQVTHSPSFAEFDQSPTTVHHQTRYEMTSSTMGPPIYPDHTSVNDNHYHQAPPPPQYYGSSHHPSDYHRHPTIPVYRHSSPAAYHQTSEHQYEHTTRRPELYRDPNSQQRHPPQHHHLQHQYHPPQHHHPTQQYHLPQQYHPPQQPYSPQQDHQSSTRRLSHQGPMQPYHYPVQATMPRRRPSYTDTTQRRSSTEYPQNPSFDHH